MDQQAPYIVAVTASAMEEDKLKCKNAGMAGFLSKPIRKKDLEAFLKEFYASKLAS